MRRESPAAEMRTPEELTFDCTFLDGLWWCRCPYSGEMTAQGAAYSGHLPMLQWLRRTTPTWEFHNLAYILSWAGLRGHTHIAKWLLSVVRTLRVASLAYA
jgi:hypothetical protein